MCVVTKNQNLVLIVPNINTAAGVCHPTHVSMINENHVKEPMITLGGCKVLQDGATQLMRVVREKYKLNPSPFAIIKKLEVVVFAFPKLAVLGAWTAANVKTTTERVAMVQPIMCRPVGLVQAHVTAAQMVDPVEQR
jgi:hypothetical protein